MPSCSHPLWKTSPYSTRFSALEQASNLSSAYTPPTPVETSEGSEASESPMMRTCTAVACVVLVGILVFVVVNSLYAAASGKACGSVSGKHAALDQPILVPENDAELDAAIAQHSKVLVMFMAPWCGHCKACKGDYAKAAARVSDTTFVMADCEHKVSQAKLQEHGIKGFPTFKLFKGGKFHKDFDQARTEEGFAKFCAAN